MDTLEPNVVENLKAGFKKCGIVPLNVEVLAMFHTCQTPTET